MLGGKEEGANDFDGWRCFGEAHNSSSRAGQSRAVHIRNAACSSASTKKRAAHRADLPLRPSADADADDAARPPPAAPACCCSPASRPRKLPVRQDDRSPLPAANEAPSPQALSCRESSLLHHRAARDRAPMFGDLVFRFVLLCPMYVNTSTTRFRYVVVSCIRVRWLVFFCPAKRATAAAARALRHPRGCILCAQQQQCRAQTITPHLNPAACCHQAIAEAAAGTIQRRNTRGDRGLCRHGLQCRRRFIIVVCRARPSPPAAQSIRQAAVAATCLLAPCMFEPGGGVILRVFQPRTPLLYTCR